MNQRWAESLVAATEPDGRISLARLGELVGADDDWGQTGAKAAAALARAHQDMERLRADLMAQIEARTRDLEDARRVMQATLDNVDQGIVMFDVDDCVPVFNRRAMELLGIPPHVVAGRPTRRAILQHQIDAGEFEDAPPELQGLIQNDLPLTNASCYERRRPNGVVLDVRTVTLDDGRIVRTYADVTDLRARENDLRRAESEYRALFEHAIVGIYKSSLDGRQIRANPALVRLNGYEKEEELLAAVNDIASEWYVDPKRREEFRRQIEENDRVTDFVSEIYRHKTRERIWISESARVVRDETGAPLYYEGSVVDVTERIRAEARLTYLAHHDTLTGLANRTLFMDTLRAWAADATDDAPVSVLTINLGRFKEVNDTLGHTAGDELLRMAARRIRRVIGDGNLAARFGADAFGVLVKDRRTRSNVLQLCERIIDSLARPFRIRRQRTVVSVSVGVAFAPEHGETPDDLLRNADAALYAGRAAGPWPYSIYNDEMSAGLQERRALENDLRKALSRSELSLHFQPIVDAASGDLISAEALMRWSHPERGMIPPAEFIPIAEDSGLMIAMGEWALMQACREAAGALGGMKIAVNISPVQFRSEKLVLSVLNALNASGLPPDRLELEITESVLLNDDPATLQALTELRALGVSLALDDFGTGHSSFGYLLKFQFDKIKIDRSFIKSLDSSRGRAAIVRAVANLASDLGVKVVAEGVETRAQLAEIARLGCDQAQGYLFSKPMPAADMLAAVSAPSAAA